MRQLHIEFVFTAAIGVTFDGDVSDVRVIDEKLSDLVEQIERFGLDDGLRRLEEDLFFDVDLAFGELDFGVGIGVGATVFVLVSVESFGFVWALIDVVDDGVAVGIEGFDRATIFIDASAFVGAEIEVIGDGIVIGVGRATVFVDKARAACKRATIEFIGDRIAIGVDELIAASLWDLAQRRELGIGARIDGREVAAVFVIDPEHATVDPVEVQAQDDANIGSANRIETRAKTGGER